MQGAELQGREIRVDKSAPKTGGAGSGGRGGYGSGGRGGGGYGSGGRGGRSREHNLCNHVVYQVELFLYVSNSTCVVAGGASEDCKLFIGNLSYEVSI